VDVGYPKISGEQVGLGFSHHQYFEITMKINSCKYLVVCFVSFSILFLALPGHAQNGNLQVKCVEASGSPAQNAKVVVFSMNTQKAKDKKSDAQGAAEFAKLDDGVYRVFARKDGFAPALYEYALIKGSTETVTLTFAAGADKKLYFEDPAEAQKAAMLLQAGLEAIKANKLEEGEKMLAQSLEISPSSPETVYYYGAAFLQEGKFDKATELLIRAGKIAEMLKTTPSPNPSGTNPYELVFQGAKRLLSQMPSLKGDYALRQKNYDLAAKEYAEAIKSNPDNAEYYANLAIALTNAGKPDEALAAISKAIQLKPSEKAYTDLKAKISARKDNAALEKAQGIMNEGNALLKDGNAAEALKKFEEAKGMIPADKAAPLWRQIGKAQAKLEQPDAAIAAFKKSIEIAPADKVSDYQKDFAQFYLDSKRYDEAIDLLADPKAAASQSPEQGLLDLAKTWKNKEPNFAAAALEKVLKLNPANADAYYDLAQLSYIDGKSKDSRTKELLAKYLEIGKDPEKTQGAKDMLVIINKRTK
jgi:tetratricopeptide (TPR) repeat protein